MDQKVLNHFADYYDYYLLLASGEMPVEDVRKYMLSELKKPESTVSRQFGKIDEYPGLLIVSPEGTMSVDREKLADMLSEIMYGIGTYCLDEFMKEPDQIEGEKRIPESEFNNLRTRYEQVSAELEALKKRYAEHMLSDKVLLMDSVTLNEESVGDKWFF